MFTSRVLALLAMLLALLPLPLTAQQLEAGTRVRGEGAGRHFAGRIASAGADSLAIVDHGDTVHLRIADIRRLDVATGSRRNTLPGLGIGAGIGAAGGVLLLLAYDNGGPPTDFEGLEYAVAAGFFLGSAAVGAITGTLIKSPRWTRVRPAGLGVSISF